MHDCDGECLAVLTPERALQYLGLELLAGEVQTIRLDVEVIQSDAE